MTPQVNARDNDKDHSHAGDAGDAGNAGNAGKTGNAKDVGLDRSGHNGHALKSAPADTPRSAKTSDRNTVFVFANLPHGQAFDLPHGRQVVLQGWPVSELLGPHGERLPGGEFGVTEVNADHWEEVLRLYSEMAVLKSGLIFAAPSRKEGQAMARERASLRHGLEPVDPETLATRPDLDNQPKHRRNAM